MKVTKQVRLLHIYVPAVFPANLPGETTAHFQIMYSNSNTKCNHIHSRSLCPLSPSSCQASAQYCKLQIYPLHAKSWLPNPAISHMTPPFNRFDLESTQLHKERNHEDEGPPVSSTGRSSRNCCFNCAGYGKLASGIVV